MNPCCSLVSILCLFKNKSDLLCINFSRGMENTDTKNIGLQFCMNCLSPFLNRGFIFVFFIMSGKIPV